MAKPTLSMQDLHVAVEGRPVVQGLNLTVKGGEVHAILGPDGAGKSELAQALMGHPRYEVTATSLTLDKQNLLPMPVDQRARAGLFLAMQDPSVIPGVSNADLIRLSLNARRKTKREVPAAKFARQLEAQMEVLAMHPEFAEREINEGCSEGEKKRNEMLQMTMLKPRIAILDEIDSNLDADELEVVAQALNEMRGPNVGMLIITNGRRILEYVEPDYVHVLIGGRIVRSGDKELAMRCEGYGDDWLKDTAPEGGAEA